MTDNTNADLDAIRERWAAEAGYYTEKDAGGYAICDRHGHGLATTKSQKKARLFANAPDDIAALLAEVEHLKLFGEEAHAAGLQWTKRALAAESERDAMRAVVDAAISDLSEHQPDGCAGPRGDARRGACPDCALAERLTSALDAATGEVA